MPEQALSGSRSQAAIMRPNWSSTARWPMGNFTFSLHRSRSTSHTPHRNNTDARAIDRLYRRALLDMMSSVSIASSTRGAGNPTACRACAAHWTDGQQVPACVNVGFLAGFWLKTRHFYVLPRLAPPRVSIIRQSNTIKMTRLGDRLSRTDDVSVPTWMWSKSWGRMYAERGRNEACRKKSWRSKQA